MSAADFIKELNDFEVRLITRLDDRFVTRDKCEDQRKPIYNKIWRVSGIMGVIGIASGFLLKAILGIMVLTVAVFPAEYELGGIRTEDGAFYNAGLSWKKILSPSYQPHILGESRLNAFIPVDFDLNISGSDENSEYTAILKATEYIGAYKSKNMLIHDYHSGFKISRTSLEKTFEYTIRRGILSFTPTISVFWMDKDLDASVGLLATYDAEPWKLSFEMRVTDDESFRRYALDSEHFGTSFKRTIIGQKESFRAETYLKGSF